MALGHEYTGFTSLEQGKGHWLANRFDADVGAQWQTYLAETTDGINYIGIPLRTYERLSSRKRKSW